MLAAYSCFQARAILSAFFVFSVDYMSCPGLPRAPVDPCSRESVLKVLKESRKREVEDEDRSFTTEQRSKRRYQN